MYFRELLLGYILDVFYDTANNHTYMFLEDQITYIYSTICSHQQYILF